MSENKLAVAYHKTQGRYSLNRTDKQWNVSLSTSLGQISALWDWDEEPEVEDMLPSEVLGLIEARIKSYWIYTGRDADLAKVATIRERARDLDKVWVENKLMRLRKEVDRWDSILDGLSEAATQPL